MPTSSAFLPGRGVSAVRPRRLTVPPSVQAQALRVEDLHATHFTYPITDGTADGLHPVIGCLHSCDFCTLGVPLFRQSPLGMLTAHIDRLEELQVPKTIISAPAFTQYRAREELLDHIRACRRLGRHRGGLTSRRVEATGSSSTKPS